MSDLRNSRLIRLCRARDALRNRHSETFSIDVVAREAEMSVYHFIRTFKATFGKTPHEFLIEVRLNRAKQLLIADNCSITDICMEVGYSSLGSFSDLFSRHVGIAPSAYRRQSRSLVQVPGTISRQFVPYCFALMYAG